MRTEGIIFNHSPRSMSVLNVMPEFFARRVLPSVLFVLMAAFLSSCGLPAPEYLFPPLDFSYNGNALSLTHNPSNASVPTEFRGYEIYYRLFQNLDDANAALSYILSLAANSSPDTFMQSARTNANWPFFRMQKSYATLSATNIDTSKPLLPRPTNNAAEPFTFTIDMNTWKVTLPDNLEPVTLVRNNNKNTVAASAFNNSSNYDPTDQDYSGGASPSSVYLVLFAVAYGTSASSLSEVYSSPLIIPSSMVITFN